MGMRYVYYKNHKRKRQRLLKLTRWATYLCVDMGLLSSTAHSQSFRGSVIIFAAITTATILITNCYSNGSDSPHCRWHTYRSYLSGALMCTPIENMVQLGRFWPTWVCLYQTASRSFQPFCRVHQWVQQQYTHKHVHTQTHKRTTKRTTSVATGYTVKVKCAIPREECRRDVHLPSLDLEPTGG